MTSERQMKANRRNAKRSTGPRTTGGKTRSSRNALRHGLSRSASDHGSGFDRLASTLLEKTLPINSSDLVSVKLELQRIRLARARMLEAILQTPDLKKLNSLRGLLRYERAAFARQKRLLRATRHET
jgi:hypothetical protein